MNATRQVATNLLANYSSQTSIKLLAFVWLIAVAHSLGPADYGRLVTAISITAVLGILIDSGLSPFVTREVARDRAHAAYYLRRAIALKIVSSLLFAGLAWLATALLGYSQVTASVIHILVLFVVLQNLAAVPRSIYFAYEHMTLPSLFGFLAKVAAVVTGFLFLARGLGLVWIAASMVLEGFVELVLGLAFVRRIWRGKPQTDLDQRPGEILSRSFPFALVSVMVVLHFTIDTVLLSRLKNEIVVAWYNASFRLMAALLFLPETFASTLYPLLSRKHEDRHAFASWLDPSFRSVLLAGLAIGIVFLLSGRWVITLLYPPDFQPAAPVLRVLGMAVPLVFANAVLGVALNALNREGVRFRAALAGVLVSVALNLLLIPRYGHMGAAAATLATHFFVTLSYLVVLRREGVLRLKPVFLLRTAIALLLGGAASLAAAWAHPAVAIVVGPAVFAAACVIDGAIGKSDLGLAVRLLREWLATRPGRPPSQ
jgi:O-antigen/teichoic acid export membrane protein